jgi:transposase
MLRGNKKKLQDLNEGLLPVRLFCQDESRFGLKTIKRRRITVKGIKPLGPMQDQYENFYIYGAAEISTGENFMMEFPEVNGDCFQLFLDCFVKEYSNSLNIIILDNARFHLRKKTIVPKNTILIFLPPYSPELNPIERVWQFLKDKLAWQIFESIDELRSMIFTRIKSLENHTIKSLISYDYLQAIIA